MYVFPCGPQVFACFRMFSFFRTQHRRISQIIGASRFSRFFMILQFPAKWCFLQRVACTSVLCIPEKTIHWCQKCEIFRDRQGGSFPAQKVAQNWTTAFRGAWAKNSNKKQVHGAFPTIQDSISTWISQLCFWLYWWTNNEETNQKTACSDRNTTSIAPFFKKSRFSLQNKSFSSCMSKK